MKYNSVLYIITEQKRYFKICTTLIKLTHNKLSSGKKIASTTISQAVKTCNLAMLTCHISQKLQIKLND